MKDYTGVDVSAQPAARRVMKKNTPVAVRFARQAGVLQTLEGAVAYKARDALLTGSLGEEWPVSREHFLQSYEPLPPTRAGRAGLYTKRRLPVWAMQAPDFFSVRLAGGKGVLNGAPGSWLVQYGPGDYGVVRADIFAAAYTDAVAPFAA